MKAQFLDIREIVDPNGSRMIDYIIPLDPERDVNLTYREFYNSERFLYYSASYLFNELHGLECIYHKSDDDHNKVVTTDYNIHFLGSHVLDDYKYGTPDLREQFVTFLIKDALYRANDFSELLDDDKIFIPLVKDSINVDEALEDLSEAGLNAKSLHDVGIDPFRRDITKALYSRHFEAYESGDFDMYEVASAYMDSYDTKTFADVMVSQAVKETAEYVKGGFQESFDQSLDVYLPLVDTNFKEMLLTFDIDIHNELGRLKNRMRDFLADEKNQEHSVLRNTVNSETPRLSSKKARF